MSPISIAERIDALPWDQVVRADGDLSGYRRGQARKAELLTQEGAR